MSTNEKSEKEYLISEIIRNIRRMSIEELQKLLWKTEHK